MPAAATPLHHIARIGSDGDGIADTADGSLHIPRTLPGELVTVGPVTSVGRARRGTLVSVVSPSPDRVQPACPHFAACGGCALQHWRDAAYAAWKRNRVVSALGRAGFATDAVGALVRTPPHARRRVDLAAERVPGAVLLGLHAAHGKAIIDMRECTVLHPALLALVAPLRSLLSSLAALRRSGSVIVNLLDLGLPGGGADILLRTDGPLATPDRAKLATFGASHHIGRIAWALGNGVPETAALLATPSVSFAGRRVEPPPGTFLQASAEGEAAIVAAVLAGVPDRLTQKSRAIELFAGCGTISFPLAERLRVVAYEGDAAAAASIRRALSGTRVGITARDLVRQPLTAKELAGAACIVLDPPYGGAAMQMPAIAASGVPRIVMVSCNPTALTHDAAVLQSCGYRLRAATPIDQFLWSPHVESVSVFAKE